MAASGSTAAASEWVYDLILNIFAFLLDVFCKEVEVYGEWEVPAQGTVILVAAPQVLLKFVSTFPP